MSEHLIGDGIFTVKEENSRIIALCAWIRRREREASECSIAENAEMHMHGKGYVHGKIRGEESEITPFTEI